MTHLQSGTAIPVRHWIELIDAVTTGHPAGTAGARMRGNLPAA